VHRVSRHGCLNGGLVLCEETIIYARDARDAIEE